MAQPTDLLLNTPASNTPGTMPANGQGPAQVEPTATYIVFLSGAPGGGPSVINQRVASILSTFNAGRQSNEVNTSTKPTEIWEYLNGFKIELTESEAQRLRGLGGIQSVEANSQVRLITPPGISEPAIDPITGAGITTKYNDNIIVGGETTPWGISAVWDTKAATAKNSSNTSKYAFVIDTGVSYNTNDLNVDLSMAQTWVIGTSSATDDNGHGTHVAGTIGAIANNGKGVVGVAPGTTIVPLKVLGANGSGSLADAASAINHVLSVIALKGLAMSNVVVNLSLGAQSSYSSLDTAIRNAASQGLTFAIAAGNSSADVDGFTPARTGNDPNVFTVSAVDSAYRMAKFSNWDKLTKTDRIDNIDFAAPGVNVISLGINGALVTLSGTSMASPHLAGIILLGGPLNGGMATPFFSGTADPFAIL